MGCTSSKIMNGNGRTDATTENSTLKKNTDHDSHSNIDSMVIARSEMINNHVQTILPCENDASTANSARTNGDQGKRLPIRFRRLRLSSKMDRNDGPKRRSFSLSSTFFKRKKSCQKLSTVENGLADLGSTSNSISPISPNPIIIIDEASSPHSAPPEIGSNSNNIGCWGNGRKRTISANRKKSNEGSMVQPSSGTEDFVLKIIRCFPFPSPKPSPKSSPSGSPMTRRTRNSVHSPTMNSESTGKEMKEKRSCGGTEDKSKYLTLGMMVRGTIETTFSPLIPWDWDAWLRKRLASWTQCSGHEGTIVPATEKSVWKKCTPGSNEARAYRQLTTDAVSIVAPKFYKEVEHNGECFLELEDLSRNFVEPSIMDVKMGTRTFLESEVKKETKRADLYQKMIAVDPSEPSASEQEEKAITKLRYMTFRERMSSTASLGFRVDAVKISPSPVEKNFQKVRTREEVATVFHRFLGPKNEPLRNSLINRLLLIREKIEESEFFRSHEVIGSSILIIHDSQNVSACIIDFANTSPIEHGVLDHRSPWKLGNREDGYLFGLDNLIKLVQDLDLNE